jgi:hypothetical protein
VGEERVGIERVMGCHTHSPCLSIELVEPVLPLYSSTVLPKKAVPPPPSPCQVSHLRFRVLTRAHGVLIGNNIGKEGAVLASNAEKHQYKTLINSDFTL